MDTYMNLNVCMYKCLSIYLTIYIDYVDATFEFRGRRWFLLWFNLRNRAFAKKHDGIVNSVVENYS